MRKIIGTFAALLSAYSASSIAALPTGTSRCEVSVPSYCSGLTFGVAGLYWRPSTTQLDYALSLPGATLFLNGTNESLNHDYDWGFKANIGYVFPCSGNDINLSYTHWDNSDHRNLQPTAGGAIIPTLSSPLTISETLAFSGTVLAFAGNPPAVPATFSSSLPIDITFDPSNIQLLSVRSRFENHTWDLDFGQTLYAGCNFRLRWFGGARYTQLKHSLDITTDVDATPSTITTTATRTILITAGPGMTARGTATFTGIFDAAATIRDVVHQNNKYDGVGPRFGFDASYHLGGLYSGFGLVGELSTALLVGEHESRFQERTESDASVSVAAILATFGAFATDTGTQVTIVSSSIPAPGVLFTLNPVTEINIKDPEEIRVVPNIDAKIGLDWTYQFCNCSRSKVIIEAGYMVSHYFNTVDRLNALGVTAPEFRTQKTSNATFEGPYAGIEVKL